MFEWKDDYTVGIKTIDVQHQMLFATGRELYAAMGTGKGKTVMAEILERLVQYTKAHFAYEEGLMQSHRYPDFAKHKAEHDELTRQVLAFQTEFNAGRATMAVEVMQFLKNWLEKHIQKSDFAYAPYLTAHHAEEHKPESVAH